MYFADSKAVREAALNKSALSQNIVCRKNSSSFAGQQRVSNLKAKATFILFYFISLHFIGIRACFLFAFWFGACFYFCWLVGLVSFFWCVCGAYHILGAQYLLNIILEERNLFKDLVFPVIYCIPRIYHNAMHILYFQ